MPTYDYVCRACGYEFELFQQMSDPIRRKCPECEKLKLERLIGTGAGVIFKGGGFYETDYRSDSYRKSAEAEKKSGDEKSKTDKPAKDAGSSDGAAKTETKKSGSGEFAKKKPSSKSKD